MWKEFFIQRVLFCVFLSKLSSQCYLPKKQNKILLQNKWEESLKNYKDGLTLYLDSWACEINSYKKDFP